MNEDLVYGLLFGNILLLYLIGLRIRVVKRDVEFLREVVLALGDHPFFDILGMKITRMMVEEEEDESGVPDAFRQWDES